MKKRFCLSLVTAMALALTACSGGGTEQQQESASSGDSETIRIGVVCPLTGESSIFGNVLSETVQLPLCGAESNRYIAEMAGCVF